MFEGYEDISISEFEININTSPGGSSAYLFGSVIYTDGSRTPLEVFLIKESTSWKIVEFSIGTERSQD